MHSLLETWNVEYRHTLHLISSQSILVLYLLPSVAKTVVFADIPAGILAYPPMIFVFGSLREILWREIRFYIMKDGCCIKGPSI